MLLSLFLSLAAVATAQRADCIGPRTAGELRAALWKQNPNYDLLTRPNEANASRFAGFAPPEAVETQLQVFRVSAVDGVFMLAMFAQVPALDSE